MKTADSTIALPQTLGLLDCMEVVQRQDLAEAQMTDPKRLKEHLQTVAANLAQPLTNAQAERAVALYRAPETAPAWPTRLLSDRPMSPAALKSALEEANQNQVKAQRHLRRFQRRMAFFDTRLIGFALRFGGVCLALKAMAIGMPGGFLDRVPLGTMGG